MIFNWYIPFVKKFSNGTIDNSVINLTNISSSIAIKINMTFIQMMNFSSTSSFHPFIFLFVHSSINSLIHPFIYSFILPSIHPLSRKSKPRNQLSSSADGRYEVSYKPNVVIFSIGDVMWIPPAIYKSSCTINVLYFPFDEQKCFMKFGSWTFNGDQVITHWLYCLYCLYCIYCILYFVLFASCFIYL